MSGQRWLEKGEDTELRLSYDRASPGTYATKCIILDCFYSGLEHRSGLWTGKIQNSALHSVNDRASEFIGYSLGAQLLVLQGYTNLLLILA